MLKKLSLAALIAMGGMSFASATPLTEAIKNVDLNGMLRIRFYYDDPDGSHSYRRWRTNGIFIFKVPVSENIKFVVRNSVQTDDSVHDDGVVSASHTFVTDIKEEPKNSGKYVAVKKANIDDPIVNNLLFMAYSNGNLNAIVGKIPVATPVTSADPAAPGHGAGAIATYKVNDNLTGAAFFIDALENPSDNTGLGLVIPNNIYGAAAIFNVESVKGQVWFFHVTNVMQYLVTASLDAKLPTDYNVGLHVDLATGDANDAAVKNSDAKTYFNVSLKASMDAACVKVGYAYTDKNTSPVEFSADAPIGAVIPTANNYNIANLQDTSSIYGKLGYQVDANTNVYLAAQYQNAGNDAKNPDNDLVEYTIGANYKANKKLSFSAYYDVADWDSKATNADGTKKQDKNEFRFEAKYTF